MSFKLQDSYQDKFNGLYLVLGEAAGPWVVQYHVDGFNLGLMNESSEIYKGEPRKASRIACMRARLALDHPDSETAKHLKEHF